MRQNTVLRYVFKGIGVERLIKNVLSIVKHLDQWTAAAEIAGRILAVDQTVVTRERSNHVAQTELSGLGVEPQTAGTAALSSEPSFLTQTMDDLNDMIAGPADALSNFRHRRTVLRRACAEVHQHAKRQVGETGNVHGRK